MIEIIIATIGVFLGELYGSIVGGGSLVTQIALQNILHFDIKTAMALDNAAVLGSNIGMLLVLFRKHIIKWWFVLFTFFQGIGAYFGAILLVWIDPSILKFIFIVALLLLVVKNLLFADTHKDTKGYKETYVFFICISFAAIFIGAYNAAFVIGDWVIALLILTSVFRIRYHSAIFLLTVSAFFSQPIAVYQYYVHGLLDMYFLIPMIIATTIGGMISAYLLSNIQSEKMEHVLKYLSVGLVVYLVVSLLF